ncbi:uncharacterized protein LOC125613248 isoform X2 [Marmota marmota marmota]|uniref:uncharacterized protein LOC125613248 isoform X2 n=1 Tax=Marmota marmota marmota TaxID=9994 RepID=UPI0020929AFC|nr:uncharacterized protein LOC125613248 isoform X2 [Marmota marmota marmota]
MWNASAPQVCVCLLLPRSAAGRQAGRPPGLASPICEASCPAQNARGQVAPHRSSRGSCSFDPLPLLPERPTDLRTCPRPVVWWGQLVTGGNQLRLGRKKFVTCRGLMEGHFIQAGSRGETPGGQDRGEDKARLGPYLCFWEKQPGRAISSGLATFSGVSHGCLWLPGPWLGGFRHGAPWLVSVGAEVGCLTGMPWAGLRWLEEPADAEGGRISPVASSARCPDLEGPGSVTGSPVPFPPGAPPHPTGIPEGLGLEPRCLPAPVHPSSSEQTEKQAQWGAEEEQHWPLQMGCEAPSVPRVALQKTRPSLGAAAFPVCDRK